MGPGLGPGLRNGAGLVAASEGPSLTPASLSLAPTIQRPGFLSLTLATSGTFCSPLIFTVFRILSPLSRINLLSSGFFSLEKGGSQCPF